MRPATSNFIKEHRGETYHRKTGTLNFFHIETGETIPSHVAEELDRLNKFYKTFGPSTSWSVHYTIR